CFKSFEQPVILVAHNNKVFDARILVKAFKTLNMLEELKQIVIGFIDTLPFFRNIIPGKQSYRQDKSLHGKYSGQKSKEYTYDCANTTIRNKIFTVFGIDVCNDLMLIFTPKHYVTTVTQNA
ncbi:hypothetical protein QZH41_020724, partial [Actinostola sp. cb2023]